MKNKSLSLLTSAFALVAVFVTVNVDAKSMVYTDETVVVAPAWTRPPFMSSSQLRNLHNQLINARTTGEINTLLDKFHPRSININFQDKDGNTALHRAAASGSEPRIRALMSRCPEWRIKNKAGQTPVDLANRIGPAGQKLGALIMELGKQCGMQPAASQKKKQPATIYTKSGIKIPKY